MLAYVLTFPEWGPLVLRVALGVAFIAHGYPKLFKMLGGVAAWFDSISIRPGKFWALVVGVVEFFGGTALVLGIFTQLAALLVAVVMLVAMAKVKWGSTKFVETERAGWELDLIYFAAALSLVVTGPGAYALGGYAPVGY